MQDKCVFKVLLPSELATLKRDGRFNGAPSDVAVGFIHMSTALQLGGTIEKHFNGVRDACILTVDVEALGEHVRWEVAKNGQIYPHLFGSLPFDAVLAYGPLERDETGAVQLPVVSEA